MARLGKADLEQMGEEYFRSLASEQLVEVAKNLHELAVEQLEKLEETSKTSSRPPSSDSPYHSSSVAKEEGIAEEEAQVEGEQEQGEEKPETAPEHSNQAPQGNDTSGQGFGKRKAGRQAGAKITRKPHHFKAERIIVHYPEQCVACNSSLEPGGDQDEAPYMGYYQLELYPSERELKVECQLHHYYGATCSCGHHTQARPGQGDCSQVEGRTVQLQLQDYVLVGSMLASFIASLSVRYRLSRPKIQEFLRDWLGLELSVGTIDRSIREAGFACAPVVEQLLEQLQDAEILHVDETPWYESGQLCWLWVAVSSVSVVFMIGKRTKAFFLQLVSTAFVGWLVTDGYGAYSHYQQRQRCLAHLIRKALALAQAVDAQARQLAQWLLEEMRELIHALSTAECDDPLDPATVRLQRAALLASASEHPKLKALAKEILNDWDAVVAFVANPQLPPTNNEAERALRHAVIARRISYGTRSDEGSRAYAALLSVIETCRLRQLNPWTYLAQVITDRRKGLPSPAIPFPLPQAG